MVCDWQVASVTSCFQRYSANGYFFLISIGYQFRFSIKYLGSHLWLAFCARTLSFSVPLHDEFYCGFAFLPSDLVPLLACSLLDQISAFKMKQQWFHLWHQFDIGFNSTNTREREGKIKDTPSLWNGKLLSCHIWNQFCWFAFSTNCSRPLWRGVR